MWHSEDLAERGVIQRSGCLAGGSRIVQTPVGCGKLQDIIDTEHLTCTERILRPDAGMVIHHTLIERSHAGWLEEDSWNKLELGPRGAIIAKRSGYCTTIAYVPSPTQFLTQLSGPESSSGESPLLVQGMDYDTIPMCIVAKYG